MPDTIRDLINQREEKEKQEVIDLLQKQLDVERRLVDLYETTHRAIESKAVRLLLHMIQLDSRKHIDICQLVISVLQGEDVLKEEREYVIQGLQQHLKLEQAAIDMANKILKNVWIEETEGLKELIRTWRDEEKDHHKTLKKLADQRFFRMDPFDFVGFWRSTDELEERYLRSKKYGKDFRLKKARSG